MAQKVEVISLITSVSGAPILEERIASEAGIIPGMLVEENSGTLRKHATAAANAQRLFAQTNKAVAGTIDDAYANGDTVSYGAYRTGQKVNALVAASAAAIVDGNALESAGNGTVRVATADAATDTAQRDAIVGYATENVDNSGGGSSVRIKIRIA